MKKHIFIYICIVLIVSCNGKSKQVESAATVSCNKLIVDCNYTFEQAVNGSKAPESLLKQLVLLNVKYYSTDHQIHQGQVLTNKTIATAIQYMFNFMLKERFPIAHAIPMVKYHWDDDAAMLDNNTSSFCYRNVGFSLHARGLAIDINPFFNPVRWKPGWNRIDKPQGAIYNPSVNGTFTAENKVVMEFEKLRFHWGGKFTAKCDYHHFEKAGYYKSSEVEADSVPIPKSTEGNNAETVDSIQ